MQVWEIVAASRLFGRNIQTIRPVMFSGQGWFIRTLTSSLESLDDLSIARGLSQIAKFFRNVSSLLSSLRDSAALEPAQVVNRRMASVKSLFSERTEARCTRRAVLLGSFSTAVENHGLQDLLVIHYYKDTTKSCDKGKLTFGRTLKFQPLLESVWIAMPKFVTLS